MSETAPHKKVLLIGWDAADWKAINPLIDAGKMPNLEKLINEGISGNLATLQPVLSPMLWSSIATGKRPYKHGIHGFSEPDPITGGIRPVTNLSRKTKAVWNILNQSDLNSTVVGWWPSHPAEPLSKGIMVSNHYQRATGKDFEDWKMQPGTVYPERLEKVLTELRLHPADLGEDDVRPFLPGLDGMSREDLDKAAKDPRVQSLMKIIADCTSIHSAATGIIQNEPWDFMAVYYDAIDHFGHAFMKYHPPRREHIDEWDYKVFNYCLEGGYRYHDMMLGTLLSLAGEDTTIILMSDHGFHPDHLRPSAIPREPAGPAVEHRQFGIFVAKGPGIKADDKIYGANLLDICPTLLHLFGLPVGEDMDGKVLLDMYCDPPGEIERIPSWDEVAGDHGMHPPDKQIAPADSKAALDQLVALGYIDQPNEDKTKALDETVRELDYNLAQAYIDGGIYGEAIIILERLYAKWPMEHRFGLKLATCYQSLGRTKDLREVVGTIIKRRIEEANEAATTLKELKLDDPEKQKEEKERVEKMPQQEKQKFQRERSTLVAKARPNLFTLHYLEASADFTEKRYDDALQKLEQLDSDYGARRTALSLRGDIYLRQRNWEQAKKAFEEVLEIDEETSGAHLGLARAALAAHDFETAASRARRSIGLLFFQPRAHYILGLAHYRMGDWEHAQTAFAICIRQAPLFSAAYRMLGEIAKYHLQDTAAAASFQAMVVESRRRLRESRLERVTEARVSGTRLSQDAETAPMPELLPRPEALKDVSEEEIITIVTGLPRSGTSLMMQILEAAGVPALTDAGRPPDSSNQRGYYEHERASSLLTGKDKSWLLDARGKALKVVAPLLAALPPGHEGKRHAYRVLFMERSMEEVLESQSRMLAEHDKSSAGNGDTANIAKAYRQQVRHARAWCSRLGIPAMAIDYTELVRSPGKHLPDIATFLGKEQSTSLLEKMKTCVEPALYRARR
ncbi:MAG: tetratricopeptide (TPR) repeat protein [Verrucomicrobiales bacterium]|jgi:tetratricopeptide (TPR) repeat protein